MCLTNTLTYRTLVAEDGPALRALFGTPDMGGFRVARIFHHDPLDVLETLDERPGGVVAIDGERVVAALLIRRAPVQWNGETRKGVFVGNVTVHENYRRRGISRELQKRSLELYAEDCDQALVYGSFQESNNASLNMVRDNLSYRTHSVVGGIFHRSWLPPKRRGLVVRETRDAELPAVANGMNQFFRNHQLWSPQTAHTLEQLRTREIGGHRPHKIFVACDADKVVAGLILRDSIALEQMRLFGLSLKRRVLGQLAGVLDGDGFLRSFRTHSLWFAPGEEEALATLVDTLRYRMRHRGALSSLADPKDPVADVVHRRVRMNRTRICHMANIAGDERSARPIYKHG